jgi:N utilization substance protein B
MQSLFALQQCKDANYELCLEKITDMLSPDLNSMEVQNKAELAGQKKQALQLFKEAFSKEETSIDHKDPKIKKAVNDCLTFYYHQNKKDSNFFAKNLVSEVEKIYDRYIAVLSLAIEFLELAEADKKVSHKNFVNNRWLNAIRDSPEMKKELKKIGRHWGDKLDRVRVWFRDVVRQETEYLHYLDKKILRSKIKSDLQIICSERLSLAKRSSMSISKKKYNAGPKTRRSLRAWWKKQ